MIITCACGTTFEKTGRGRPPVKCEECRKDKRPIVSMKHWTKDLDKEALDIRNDLMSSSNKTRGTVIAEILHDWFKDKKDNKILAEKMLSEKEVPNKLVEYIIGDATHLVPKDGDHRNLNADNYEIKRELTCEFGHTWMAPVRPGRPPRFCPEHINKAPRISERTTSTKHQGDLLHKILEAPAAVSCHCGITPETTPAELRAIGDKSCTHPHHICSTLDACRRAMGM